MLKNNLDLPKENYINELIKKKQEKILKLENEIKILNL